MEFGHEDSIKAVTKDNPELKKFLSIDKNVTKDFPKTFIWHTTFDTVVKVQNSLALALELEKNKIFFELHIYPMHDHGQALATEAVYNKVKCIIINNCFLYIFAYLFIFRIGINSFLLY